MTTPLTARRIADRAVAVLAAAMAVVLLLPLAASAAEVQRLAGPTRYETAVALTQQRFDEPPADLTVMVVSGSAFADALMAGPTTADLDTAAMLPVQRDAIPGPVAAELQRLRPRQIIVVGGTGVVSAAVERQLAGYAPNVSRIAGPTRYDTAVALTQLRYDEPPQGLSITIVSGDAFPDALMAGPFTAELDTSAMLPVQRDAIPGPVAAELRRLRPQSIYVVGGTGVVSADVADELAGYAPNVSRIAGPTRYETAVALTQLRFEERPQQLSMTIVSGSAFADALMAGPFTAELGTSAMLPVQRDAIPGPVAAELRRLRPGQVFVVGGEAVVSGGVAQQLRDL